MKKIQFYRLNSILLFTLMIGVNLNAEVYTPAELEENR